MKKSRLVDWDAVESCADEGVITLTTLHLLGVTRHEVHRRVSSGGPWSRLLPGVVLLTNAPPTTRQRLRGALAYAGTGAMLTGASGCVAHGMNRLRWDANGPVHLLIPGARQRQGHGYVIIERTVRPPRPVTRAGLPCAPVERSVLDLARRMTRLDDIRAVIAEAVQRGMTRPERLDLELARGTTRGTARPRRVLAEISAGTRSVAESWARQVAARSGLPPAQWNVSLTRADGSYLGTPDGWWPEVRLAWEIDSYEFHLAPEDYARTLRRNAAMVTEGILVLQTLPNRLLTEPDVVIEELRAAYRQAARRRGT